MSATDSPASPLSTPAVAAINHLLAQEAWARAALIKHAGKEACIDVSGFALRLRVGRDGLLEASDAASPASVTIRVKAADLPLILQNRERAFSYVKIEGDAEFANTISQLSKGLRWEAESDLERWIGPIAATRLVGGARHAVEAVRVGHRKAAENVAEFLTEEQNVLVRPHHVEAFGGEIVRLRDDVERAAKRLARLEQVLDQKLPAPVTGNTFLDR
jgi:ubiquinone biosynthesis protein UbiJ